MPNIGQKSTFFYKLSGKKILDLFKKALFRRLTAIVAADAAELFQQFLLPRTEVDRRFHLKFHPQVAFVDRTDFRHSLAFDFQSLAALGTGRNLNFYLVSVNARNFYRTAERGTGHRHRNLHEQIRPLPAVRER